MSTKVLHKIQEWRQHVSLTVKMVAVTVILGMSLWAILEFSQSYKLKQIFHVRLFEELTEHSIEDRLHIDRYIRSYQQSAELFATQKHLIDYIGNKGWSKEDSVSITYYDSPPPWYLKPSIQRILARPRYTMILDKWKRVREVYHEPHYPRPVTELLTPDTLTLLKSNRQSFVTSIAGTPYLLTSKRLDSPESGLQAILMLASPIDEEFLIDSKGPFSTSRLVALTSIGPEPKIVVSSDQTMLPPGTAIHRLKDSFLITGHHTHDYGAAEYILKLVSFVPMSEVDKLTMSVISTGRYQRNIIAPAFVLTFAVIMLLITRRISRLNDRIAEFSEKTLGTQRQKQPKGDQLLVLERRFQRLTEEIVKARDQLSRQAEEKTRLIVKNVFDAIITMNTKSEILTWNPQAEVMFGWTKEEAVGKNVLETIIPGKYRQPHINGLKSFLNTGDGPVINSQVEMSALHRNGHEFPVELAISPAGSGENFFFIAVIRDISERKQAEDRIRASLNEKDLLLKEVHHRVKNNMQIISSLLNLQASYIKDKEYRRMLEESRNRIKSMALVHEKLYRSRDLAKININDYITSIANSLFSFYGLNSGLINLSMDSEELELDINTAIPCGLIINELISNAMKHAFPEHKEGEIYISLRSRPSEDGNNMFSLTVRDNGIGIPEDFDIENAETLGMQLINTLVQHQLGGSLDLVRQGGTAFHIAFEELKYGKRL